jgi:hypothetical protein
MATESTDSTGGLTGAADAERVLDLLATAWMAPAVHAAAALGVAEALGADPRPVAAVAEAVGADAGALRRLLRALAAVGLVRWDGDAVAITPAGARLRADAPGSLRPRALLAGPGIQSAWAQLADCVRTGATAGKLVDGVDDPFAWFEERPDQQARLNEAVADSTRQVADAIAAAYDFTGVRTLVDVGGGHGALLPAILRANPAMTATVVDKPHCEAGATRLLAEAGLAGRASFVAGDFLTGALPAGADAYVLKSVLHDWDDEHAAGILRRCRLAMPPGARLLIVEVVLPEGTTDSPADRRLAWADLQMLVATGGRDRTRSQYTSLLRSAGLHLRATYPTATPTPLTIVEATPG